MLARGKPAANGLAYLYRSEKDREKMNLVGKVDE